MAEDWSSSGGNAGKYLAKGCVGALAQELKRPDCDHGLSQYHGANKEVIQKGSHISNTVDLPAPMRLLKSRAFGFDSCSAPALVGPYR